MIRNLYNQIPDTMSEELFQTLLEGGYDQNRDEWVVLLSGRAGLLFEGESNITELCPGDYVLIRAHRRYRVEWTDSNEKTVWLAFHYEK